MTTNPDLRPGFKMSRFSFRGRKFGHWTPTYLFHRIRSIKRAKSHPFEPSLTPQSVSQLSELLRPSDVGAEWGSGNSTRWFAMHTRHLTSFETSDPYYAEVREGLRRLGLTNVDYRLMSYADLPNEDEIHKSAWVGAALAVPDESLDYALIDTSPRGCLSFAMLPKVKSGGLVILDNANWYLLPPPHVRPLAPGTIAADVDHPDRHDPDIRCWRKFANETRHWRRLWSSDGIQMTLILFKP